MLTDCFFLEMTMLKLLFACMCAFHLKIVKLANSEISLSGSIDQYMILYTNATYLIQNDLIVQQHATLTVMPNVTIKLNVNSTICVMGRLDFLGTLSQPIHLEWYGDYTRNYNSLFGLSYAMALYYSYYARPSTVRNLNVDLQVTSGEWCVISVEYMNHRFENFSINNHQKEASIPIVFNNPDPFRENSIIGLKLVNTNLIVYGTYSSSLDLLNSTFIGSNVEVKLHPNFYLGNFWYVDTKSIYNVNTCSLGNE